jgi:hypothetical protein
MAREPEPWGGEVHLPGWLRRLLRRPAPPADSPERSREGQRKSQPTVTVGQNADRASVGVLTELYHEGRKPRRRQS